MDVYTMAKGYVFYLFPILTFLSMVEVIHDLKKGRDVDVGESLANYGVWAGSLFVKTIAGNAIRVGSLAIIASYIPYKLPNTWWALALTLVFVDFIYYYKHWIEHNCRWYWAMHAVHHSSEDFRLNTSFRLPWFEPLIDWPFFIPAVLLGMDPGAVFLCYGIILLGQFWVHTQKIPKLPWLDGWLNTPSNHRVHHAKNPQYIDRNLGGLLIIWDRIFGTYAEEVEKPVYGITKPVDTQNPVLINTKEFSALWEDIKTARNGKEVLSFIFRNPGWRPSPTEEKREAPVGQKVEA